MNHDRNFLIIFQRIRGSYYHVFIHGLRTHDDYIPNSSNIYIPLKCLKSLAFCRNNGWLMENHVLGAHKDKIYAKSSTWNTPQFIRPVKSANYLGLFWKKRSHHMSIVYGHVHRNFIGKFLDKGTSINDVPRFGPFLTYLPCPTL